jgi:sulfur relay (sulfurtransferase) DsrF/TusC family protein
MSNITILIPTSPIPSHPSTAILDETISNIRKYTDAKIIIMADGVHPSLEHRAEDYKQYLSSVFDKLDSYGDAQLFIFPDHVHQAIMTKYVLSNIVKTPLILFCEHDTSPIGDIPFDALCRYIENNEMGINYVRFNIFHEILPEHQHLMLDKKPQLHYIKLVGGEEHDKLMLVRTIQYSQRPHIASAKWYLEILKAFFGDKKTMIEDVMHSVVQETYKERGLDIFGLAIYTPEGNQLRSYHSDGRGGDEKIIEA